MRTVTASESSSSPEVNFATLDLLPDGVVLVDQHGAVLYYNDREEQIARRRKADVIGRNFFTEVAPCTQVREFYGRFKEVLLEPSARTSFAFQFPLADGPRDVEVTLNSFRRDGAAFCLISVRDITELRHVRDQILRAERLKEVGEVAAGVAHNFNNILAVIRASAELVLRHLPEGDRDRGWVERIVKASDDGAEIVRRIHESTRMEADAPRAPIALNDVVRDCAGYAEEHVRGAEASRAARIVLVLELADDLPAMWGSAPELREVFLNLIRNAVDAIPADGTITVKSFAGDGAIYVRVEDDGKGMARDVLERIFRPLFTTKGVGGMGMGLATCYGIVRRHGGDITVDSAPDRGTVFTVRLPAGNPSVT